MSNPVQVHGAWRLGWVIDVHTISSEFVGYDPHGVEQFHTVRSPLGEAMYRLKYRGQLSQAKAVSKAMAQFMLEKPNAMARIDVIVPVPPSTKRTTQPVAEIATHLAKGLKRTLAVNAVTKIKDTPSLKSVHDADSRRELLEGAFRVDVSAVVGKGVLLIDDLYRSGATANSVALSLISAGAARVYFLAATRTRSNT